MRRLAFDAEYREVSKIEARAPNPIRRLTTNNPSTTPRCCCTNPYAYRKRGTAQVAAFQGQPLTCGAQHWVLLLCVQGHFRAAREHPWSFGTVDTRILNLFIRRNAR